MLPLVVFVVLPAWSWSQETLLPADRPLEQVVDHYIAAQLKEAKIPPAPPADDAALVRRLTLDLVGRIPTVAETDAYLSSVEPDKKIKLVERLMASPGFARHQAREFQTLLDGYDPSRKGMKKGALYEYLLTSFTEKRSWDQIFREVMLPDENDPKTRGAGEFLKARLKDVNRLTVDTSSVFFGVNVSCAQCHDHPHVQSWTQDHFYGMKAFLARTVDSGGFLGEKDFGVVKYTPNKGQEKVAPVMFLTGKTIDDPGMKEPTREEKKKEQERLDEAKKAKKAPAAANFSLRAKLVETALEPGQRDFFARNIVNRVWHRLHGRGLVMPLDQMHTENPASHPQLLAWLARDLVEHRYDLRRLVRGLVLSETYARSSRWEGDNFPQDRYFAVAQARPLTPMQMAASLKLASLDPTTWTTGDLETKMAEMEKSAGRFADLFPQPGDNFQVGVSEAMLFANNQGFQKDILEGPGTLFSRLQQIAAPNQKADLAVRTILSRPARPEDVQALADYLRRRQDRGDAATQQILWALFASAEFRFNH